MPSLPRFADVARVEPRRAWHPAADGEREARLFLGLRRRRKCRSACRLSGAGQGCERLLQRGAPSPDAARTRWVDGSRIARPRARLRAVLLLILRVGVPRGSRSAAAVPRRRTRRAAGGSVSSGHDRRRPGPTHARPQAVGQPAAARCGGGAARAGPAPVLRHRARLGVGVDRPPLGGRRRVDRDDPRPRGRAARPHRRGGLARSPRSAVGRGRSTLGRPAGHPRRRRAVAADLADQFLHRRPPPRDAAPRRAHPRLHARPVHRRTSS